MFDVYSIGYPTDIPSVVDLFQTRTSASVVTCSVEALILALSSGRVFGKEGTYILSQSVRSVERGGGACN